MNRQKAILILLLALSLGTPESLLGQRMSFDAPEGVGLSAEKLDLATDMLRSHVEQGNIAGVVAAVARDGQLVYFESLGMMDLDEARPMRDNALFRMYSMTRQITSAAVLHLYQQGAFQFDDPIKMYLPDFADQRVLLDPNSTDISQTRARLGDITVAHLLTHTSGLGSRSSALYREHKVRDKNISLDEMVKNAATVPLFHDPGSHFRYGIHATILGKLVEVWSGKPFEEYLQENILAPLGMNDTMFWAEGVDAQRLAAVYRPTDGRLLPHQIETVPWTMRPRLIEGGVGLLSSVMDFVHFSQMVLDRGQFAGSEILAPEVVDLMYQNAVPEQAMPIGEQGYWRGSGWTLGGFNLVMDSTAYEYPQYPMSNGTIWWDGSAGTAYFIDPNEDMVIVIMAQVSPSRGGGFREQFKQLVDEAIIEHRD